MKYCSLIPHEAVEKYGSNFRVHPVGTGPFYLKYWNEGVSMLLLRNDHYFEKKESEDIPFIHGVFITFINSRSTEFLKFKSGELDYLSDVDPAFKSNLFTGAGQLKKDWTGKVNFKKFVFLNTEYIGFNVKDSSQKNIFADAGLRRAISYGIDKENICTYLLHGIGVPATHGFIPYGLPVFDVNGIKGYAYNPSLAEKLAAPFHHLQLTLNCSPDNEGICNFAAANLEEIGLNVQVVTIQPKALNQMMVKGETGFFRGSWVADYPEAENFLACFYSGYGAPPDYSRFHNRIFDSLYEKSLATINDSARNVVYKKMDQLVIDEAPVIPLYYDEGIELTQPFISGLTLNSTGLLDLRHVRIN
jgi:peptide/nickel transport system substrate-binding protein